MKSGQDPRHLARILALQTLFNNIFQQTSNFPVKEIAYIDKIKVKNISILYIFFNHMMRQMKI